MVTSAVCCMLFKSINVTCWKIESLFIFCIFLCFVTAFRSFHVFVTIHYNSLLFTLAHLPCCNCSSARLHFWFVGVSCLILATIMTDKVVVHGTGWCICTVSGLQRPPACWFDQAAGIQSSLLSCSLLIFLCTCCLGCCTFSLVRRPVFIGSGRVTFVCLCLHFKLICCCNGSSEQEENLSAMNTDPWYSAYHYSHPPLVERLQALDDVEKKKFQ